MLFADHANYNWQHNTATLMHEQPLDRRFTGQHFQNTTENDFFGVKNDFKLVRIFWRLIFRIVSVTTNLVTCCFRRPTSAQDTATRRREGTLASPVVAENSPRPPTKNGELAPREGYPPTRTRTHALAHTDTHSCDKHTHTDTSGDFGWSYFRVLSSPRRLLSAMTTSTSSPLASIPSASDLQGRRLEAPVADVGVTGTAVEGKVL